MRRLFVLFALTLVAAGTTASASNADHSGPELRAYGHGAVGTVEFDFSARLGPHEAATLPVGEPHGYVRIKTPTGSLSADVSCLVVIGNRAHIVATITKARGTLAGREVRLDVADNTIPGELVPIPDEFRFDVIPVVTQACRFPQPGAPITEGDIVVEQG